MVPADGPGAVWASQQSCHEVVNQNRLLARPRQPVPAVRVRLL